MSTETLFEKIVEPIIALPPSSYEGYLYRFTNVTDGMIYIGAHKGSVADNYQHSSTNPIFKQAFVDSTSQFKYEVLSYGTWDDMRSMEYKTLKDVDARNNPNYYNLTNGSPAYRIPDLNKCKALIEEIKNDVYPITIEHIDAHRSMKYVQSRYNRTLGDLVREIVAKLDDAKGSTAKCSPVLVFEGRSSLGDDLRIDGNNTVQGIDDCTLAQNVPTVRIPYDVIESFTDLENILMGDLMNAKPDIVKREISTDDAIKFLEESYKNNIPVDSTNNRECLKAFGFTSKGVDALIKRGVAHVAKIEWKSEYKMAGLNWIDYTVSTPNTMMKSQVQTFNNEKGWTSYYTSSANIKIDMLLIKLHQVFKNDGVTKAKIVLHHPSPKAKKHYENVTKPLWFGKDGIIDTVLDDKFTVDFFVMDCTCPATP